MHDVMCLTLSVVDVIVTRRDESMPTATLPLVLVYRLHEYFM